MTYIEREALPVTEIVERKRIFKDGRARTTNVYTKVVTLKDLNAAPAADVVPVKHGRWKFDAYCYEWVCSECQDWREDGCMDKSVLSNYCPNCGAKMDLED